MKFITANTDGGSRGNPGPSGYAAIIRHGENVVGRLSGFIPNVTNNIAEYAGVIAALKFAAEAKVDGLIIYADSELVVKQMNGEYKVNEKLAPSHDEASMWASHIPFVFYEHIRREKNKEADELYNLTLNTAKLTGKF